MVFDKYSRQVPGKPGSGSEPSKPAGGAPSSSYLSRLAGQVGTGGSSSSSPSAGLTGTGSSQVWRGSDSKHDTRASIEKRLHWVETAFKKSGDPSSTSGSGRTAISSIRNRINALLTYNLTPAVRSELESIDKELANLL